MNLNRTINYEKVPAPQMRRSVIPIPFKNDMTAPMSKIVPVFVQDVLPGTSVKMRSAAQIRLLRPFKVPMFDYMKAQFFWFFTPYRVLSAYWEKFIAGSLGSSKDGSLDKGTSAGEPQDWSVDAQGDLKIPPLRDNTGVGYIGGDKLTPGSIFDYMGIPVPKEADRVSSKGYNIKNSMPFRAYNMIFNEYFRDENLQDKVSIDYDSSYTNYGHCKLLEACKIRDYFTTALIKPEKSNPVTIPGIQGQAPLNGDAYIGVIDNSEQFRRLIFEATTEAPAPNPGYGIRAGNALGFFTNKNEFLGASGRKTDGGETPSFSVGYADVNVFGKDTTMIPGDPTDYKRYPLKADLSGVYANLGSTEGLSLNNLRTLVQVNKYVERLAVGGSRYGEVVQAFFGTNPGDKRLQVPEFLGVGTIDINVQEVVQTTGEGTDLGVTGARSNSVSGAGSWFKSFSEHGVLMCVMVIRQKQNSYQQGLPRMFSKSTRLDLYWPTFAFISYQPILNKELYYVPDNAEGQRNEQVFGYQMPYQEHRTMPNQVHGDLLTNSSNAPLDFWNLADYFDDLPTLGSEFIKSHPNNLNRSLLGEQTEDRPFVVNFRVNADWTLPMPVNAMPGLMDHF